MNDLKSSSINPRLIVRPKVVRSKSMTPTLADTIAYKVVHIVCIITLFISVPIFIFNIISNI